MTLHGNADGRSNQPIRDGRATVVWFDDAPRVLWWGTDGDLDRVAIHDGQVVTWPTVQACRDHARDAGWATDIAPSPDGGVDPGDVIDCRAAQAWLHRPGVPLDHVSALGLWNLHWDVRASQTGTIPVLSRAQRRCHTELTVADVPWLAGKDTHRPRWTAADLRCLRAALGAAVHAVRAALAPPLPGG